MRLAKLNRRGDTIVEAMFAIAIIGITIGSAYGIATRGLRSVHQAQERSEAVKVVESQLENIKFLASQDTPQTYSQDVFCFEPNQTEPTYINVEQGSLDNYGNCVFRNLYHVAVEKNGTTFTATARWEGLGTQRIEEVKILYRVPN